MGAELLADSSVADLCDRCSSAADVDLRHLLIAADDDELRLTQNAQPALCFTGIALTMLLEKHGIEPVAAAGHSVGEYAALAAGGAVGAPQVIKAVVERGRAMAEAIPLGRARWRRYWDSIRQRARWRWQAWTVRGRATTTARTRPV